MPLTDSVADLRASDLHESSAIATLLGYYAPGDGGGGLLYWDAAYTTADDGGMVFKPTSVSGAGRWLRAASRTIDVRWYGALADDSDDLAVRVNAVDAYLGAGPGEVLVPDGDYAVNTRIKLSSHHTLRLGRGTFSSHVEGPMITLGQGWDGVRGHQPGFASGISVIGSGWDTVLVETDNLGSDPTTNWSYLVIGVDNRDDDGSHAAYGDYVIADLKILGLDANARSQILSTLNLNNAHKATVRNVLMKNTSALGLQIGGAFAATGAFADQIWVLDCLFEGVTAQPIAAVNSRNCHVNRNTFKVGPRWSVGTLIDFELNPPGPDQAQNFEICDNLLDCRGTTEPRGGVWGIAVFSQNPTLEDNYVGPGIIANNTFIGIQYPPETITDTQSLSNPINLAYTKDVKISGNNIRFAGPVYVTYSLRAMVSDNRFHDVGGDPSLTILNSMQTFVGNNYFVKSSHFIAHWSGAISEIGSSDFSYIVNNVFLPPDGPDLGIIAAAHVTLVGAHSRQHLNFFGGRPSSFLDEPAAPGWLEIDGKLLTLRGMTTGQSLWYDGQQMVPADRRTSNNQVSLYTASDAPASFENFGGAADVVGVEFTYSRPGYITAVRFYKHPSDGASTHIWTLWSWGDNSLSAILATGNFGTETASGWQEKTLPTPIAINVGQSYVLSYDTTAGQGAGFTTGALTSGRISAPLSVPSSGGRVANAPGPTTAPTASIARSYFLDVVFQVGEVRGTNVVEFLLVDTDPTDVLTVSDPQAGNYLLSAYYRVVGGGDRRRDRGDMDRCFPVRSQRHLCPRSGRRRAATPSRRCSSMLPRAPRI